MKLDEEIAGKQDMTTSHRVSSRFHNNFVASYFDEF